MLNIKHGVFIRSIRETSLYLHLNIIGNCAMPILITNKTMTGHQIFRFSCLTLLWLALCYLLIVGRGFNLPTLFIIATSGIVVFVPLYKKYIRNGKGTKQ